MANMALNIEQRLGQKLTNEQQLLWNYILQRWPNAVFQPYFYSGIVAGTELTIYAANKIYVCYSLTATGIAVNSAANGFVTLYDETNTICLHLVNQGAIWDATAASIKYNINNCSINNIWFSRVGISIYNAISFIGYRITI